MQLNTAAARAEVKHHGAIWNGPLQQCNHFGGNGAVYGGLQRPRVALPAYSQVSAHLSIVHAQAGALQMRAGPLRSLLFGLRAHEASPEIPLPCRVASPGSGTNLDGRTHKGLHAAPQQCTRERSATLFRPSQDGARRITLLSLGLQPAFASRPARGPLPGG